MKTPEFNRVEKIKVIGSTYMAAAGLKPNRRNSIGEENDEVGKGLNRHQLVSTHYWSLDENTNWLVGQLQKTVPHTHICPYYDGKG